MSARNASHADTMPGDGARTPAPRGNGIDGVILDMLSERGSVSSVDVAAMAGVTPRTALRHLTKLAREGAIIAEGGNRNRTYRPAGR